MEPLARYLARVPTRARLQKHFSASVLLILASMLLCLSAAWANTFTADLVKTNPERGAPVPQNKRPGYLALIIDDLGNGYPRGAKALSLPGPVTYAFLPHTPHASRLAEQAFANNREVLLHIPMETVGRHRLGAGGLTESMDRIQLMKSVSDSLSNVPNVVGINNHMGSLLTQHERPMRWLMEMLRARGQLYFVDSRTTRRSVAMDVAKGEGVQTIGRDVFLDASRDAVEISRQFRRLKQLARREKGALGIAHPYPETLAFLEKALPALEAEGIKFVSVSELIRVRARREDLRSSRHEANVLPVHSPDQGHATKIR